MIAAIGTILSLIELKDWVLLALGTSIPFAFSGLQGLWRFSRDFRKITPLLGTWHSYHWSRVNFTPEVRYEKWKIRRSFPSGLRLESFDDEKTKALQYRGRAEFEGGQVVMTVASMKHRDESWQIRMYDPIPGKGIGPVMRGLFLAQDFDRRIFAALSLSFKHLQDQERIGDLLRAGAVAFPEEAALRLRDAAPAGSPPGAAHDPNHSRLRLEIK